MASKDESAFDPKQWCELHQGPAERTTYVKVRDGKLMMACQACIQTFEKRKWIKFKARPTWNYWLLSVAAPVSKNRGPLEAYEVVLDPAQRNLLRVMGFTLVQQEVNDDAES